MAQKNTKLTPFEQQTIETAKQVLEYKKMEEASIIGVLYKQPEEFYNINLTLSDFSMNIWKVYFEIAYNIIMVEKKKVLDDITIGVYLEQHANLKEKYEEYGAYGTIQDTMSYINPENLTGYILGLKKWAVVIKLCKKGFPVKNRLSDYADMTVEDIYNEFECFLNDAFIDVDENIKSYDICDGIDELIDELDAGNAIGLEYHNLPMITAETGGQYMGSITLVGGLSNVGKSTFCRTSTLPSIIEKNERIVIMLNEDGLKKWQRELLVFVCNNILKFDIQKYTVRDGKYSDEVKNKLKEAAQWLRDETGDHTITVIPFQKYKTSNVIKVIRKYASMGIKYFMLDTFKMDAGRVTDNNWLQMQQAMVDIYDVVKPEALNVHILITFQLNKGSARQRYYTQDNIGLAKNIVDPTSTCIMIRDLYEDEYPGEANAISVSKPQGKSGKTKTIVDIDRDKHYQILFIVKNREGAANEKQIVLEHDLSRNVMKEIGISNIMRDAF